MSLMRLQLDKKCKDADRLGDLAVWADYDNCKRQSGEALSDFVTRYEWTRLKCRVKGLKISDWISALNLITKAELSLIQLTLV